MGPKCNDKYPYERHTEEKVDVKTGAEIGVLQPQAKEWQHPRASERGTGQILP